MTFVSFTANFSRPATAPAITPRPELARAKLAGITRNSSAVLANRALG